MFYEIGEVDYLISTLIPLVIRIDYELCPLRMIDENTILVGILSDEKINDVRKSIQKSLKKEVEFVLITESQFISLREGALHYQFAKFSPGYQKFDNIVKKGIKTNKRPKIPKVP